MKRKSCVVMSLMLSASMLFTACGSKEAAQEMVDAVLVDAQAAGRDSLVLSNEFVGTVSPEESVYVIPMAQGKVTETFFEVGDEVQAGDVLFKIDDSGAQLQLEQAQLTYSNAKQQVDMANGVSQESTDLEMQSALAQAQSGYEQAQIAYFQVKDAYDDFCDMEDDIKKLKKKIEKGGDANDLAEMQMKLAALQEARAAMIAKGVTKESLNNQLLQAESAYRTAETILGISKQSSALVQGEVRESTKEQSQTSLALAQLGVDSAELALSYYSVTSPISGRVIGKSVEVNGMAAATSPAYTIAAEDTMTVTFQVSESIMNTLSKGQTVKVERNGVEFDGTIIEVGNAVNMQTGLFQIKASVKATGEQLPSGVSVTISSDTYTAENEIIIPYDAVYFENEGAYVYIEKDGHAVKTYVTVGIFDDTRIQITEGIAEGETVITSWSPRLIDGAEVNVKMAEASAESAPVQQ